ncbi:MAG: hypothetical protein AAGI90_03350 [Chlamydiota bacterium]
MTRVVQNPLLANLPTTTYCSMICQKTVHAIQRVWSCVCQLICDCWIWMTSLCRSTSTSEKAQLPKGKPYSYARSTSTYENSPVKATDAHSSKGESLTKKNKPYAYHKSTSAYQNARSKSSQAPSDHSAPSQRIGQEDSEIYFPEYVPPDIQKAMDDLDRYEYGSHSFTPVQPTKPRSSASKHPLNAQKRDTDTSSSAFFRDFSGFASLFSNHIYPENDHTWSSFPF